MTKQNNNGNDIDQIASLLGEEEKPAKLYIKKYWAFIMSKKAWLLLSAAVMGVAGFFGFSYYKEKAIEYTTSAIIRFDDQRSSRNISAVTDFSAGIENSGNLRILETNLFLNKVVDALNLKLIIDADIPRSIFIKSLKLTDDPAYGSYYFLISPDIKLYYQDFYTDKEVLVKKFPMSRRDSLNVDVNGINGVFSIPAWYDDDKIEFAVVNNTYAVELMREKLDFFMDRPGTILTLLYTDHDPFFAKIACNKIAELFLEQLVEFKRGKTTSILKSLEDQLTAAERELETADHNLQRFQQTNPRVYLRADRGAFIENLGQKEFEVYSLEETERQIAQLDEKLNNEDPTQMEYTYQEVLSFLDQQNQPGINSLLNDFNQKTSNLKFALTQVAESHPDVVKLKAEIERIKDETRDRFNIFKNSITRKKGSLASEISKERSTLNRMPSNQLKLAELQRKRQIKESIVSSIMARYNEALVSDAAMFANANIIDYAEEPLITEVGFVLKAAGAAGGAMVGIILCVVALVLYVMINKRFWTGEELQDKMELPVIAKLPMVKRSKAKLRFNPITITSSYKPSYSSETFRRMRTILDIKRSNHKKALIVGSLNPSEGKSYVSINLATVYAQQNKKVLLIDGDIRKGVLHNYFKQKISPGMTNFLQSRQQVDLEYSYKYLRKTPIENLYFIAAGDLVPNPAEVISSTRIKELLENMYRVFDHIIIDSAPFGLCPDIFIINSYVHSVLLVTKHNSTDLVQLDAAISEVKNFRRDFEGVVINFNTEKVKKYEGYNHYQY